MRTLLVIAGLDPSAGAGFLADARVAAEHGVRVVGVVTALTVQDTGGVRAADPVDEEIIAAQLAALLADGVVDAVKIGMLGNAEVARTVARALAATRAPVVWDPVFLPSRGATRLLAADPEEVARVLLPEARLVTPNLSEAAALTGVDRVETEEDMWRAAEALVSAGAQAALVKGGHLATDAVDILRDGVHEHRFAARRVDTGPLHGTGCVLSTAIASRLALGVKLPDAVAAAKAYLGAKLTALLSPGRGARTLV